MAGSQQQSIGRGDTARVWQPQLTQSALALRQSADGCIPEDLRDVPSNDYSALDLPFCDSTAESLDRAALVALYNSTDGPNWATSTNWLSDRPLGDWYGVTINPPAVSLSLA